MHRRLTVGLLAAAALALPACGGDEEEAIAPAVEQEPPQAESTDSIAHTASSEDGGLFDTGGIDRGKTGERDGARRARDLRVHL